MTDSPAAAPTGPVPPPPSTRPARPAGRVAAGWLPLLAGPLSFGIAAPVLILGDIAVELGVSTGVATWIVTAFGWGIALGTPLAGGVLARRGVHATLAIFSALLATGALLALLVPMLPVLVVGAALQAFGAAGLTVVAMSLADTARRMGLVTASLAVVGASSPLLGSLVSDLLFWQVTLALPALSLLAALAVARAGRSAPPSRGRFDPIGVGLVALLVTALVAVPHQPLLGVVSAAVAVVLLRWHVRARPTGFVPAAVARSRGFLVAAGLAFTLGVVNFGILYAASPLLARHTGWTTGQIGVAMLWPYLLGGALSWFLVAASARVRPGVTIGALLTAGLAAPLIVASSGWLPVLLLGMAVGSLAASTGQGALAVRATTVVPAAHRPEAIGLFNLCYLVSVGIGPAITAMLPLAN
jgi:MFS transporter, DHA2 family, metal-tetracycline-proton antiporter